MKLTFKTLKGEIFNIQAEPQATIGQVKAKIKDHKGIEIQSQKIVYRGKPAVDTQTIQALGIKQNDFLVIMNLVKKPQSKPKQQTIQKKQKQAQKQPTKPIKQEPKKQSSVPNIDEAKINQLMTMGFQRQKCVAALRAAFGNSDVAVDYLLNGIPADIAQQPGTQNVQQLLRALVATPQFAPFRQMIKSDPNALGPVLQQISATSPALYNMIVQNPDVFQKVITQQYDDDYEGDQDMEGLDEQDLGQAEQGGSIAITAQQDSAIKRLMALGFTQIDAAQAYFACDKNEEMAANLLFDRMANGDLDQQQGGGNQGANNQDDDDNLFQ